MSKKVLNKKDFGKKIKQNRERLGLTQFQLSEKVGISQNFLGDIERGIKLPSIENLIRLSNIFKVSLDSLFSASLDNILNESEEPYYTERQKAILNNVVKTIRDNF